MLFKGAQVWDFDVLDFNDIGAANIPQHHVAYTLGHRLLINSVTRNGNMGLQDGEQIKKEKKSITTLRGRYFLFAKPSQPPYTFSVFPIFK